MASCPAIFTRPYHPASQSTGVQCTNQGGATRPELTGKMRDSKGGHDPSPAATCVVGAGPAGALFAYLLDRQGLPVTLLERHADFEREFRGEALHPGALEVFEQLGLSERVLALARSRTATLAFHTPEGTVDVADLRRIGTRFPFVAIVPQADLLAMLVDEAARFPTFRFIRQADVRELIEHARQVRGVRYRLAGGTEVELETELTVAARIGIVWNGTNAVQNLIGGRQETPALEELHACADQNRVPVCSGAVGRVQTFTFSEKEISWILSFDEGDFDRRRITMGVIGRITPCLWFDDQAEEAANFYVGIFDNSRIKEITRYGTVGHEFHGMRAGSVMTVEFEIDGHPFTALNGGPQFTFNEAISLQVMCDIQDELDRYWEALGEGGDETAQQCGWLKDKFGVSWQVVPTGMTEMLAVHESEGYARAMNAMFGMKKLDIEEMRRAYDG